MKKKKLCSENDKKKCSENGKKKKKALKMTSQLVIFRGFFSFFSGPPDSKSEKKKIP